ncbi:hypothetical protein BJ508DRAFT_377562 [Ascobolus immersus RN42]|uniref:Uncharacterized protein n=1 Tax=Ascobolus immersus RN42 TaxID=1160509 RepID=A0A3N4I128_ASCIM|nr:hypothetical protein BJ508DRAFT_377562 [Ascobolus immersus RN42]
MPKTHDHSQMSQHTSIGELHLSTMSADEITNSITEASKLVTFWADKHPKVPNLHVYLESTTSIPPLGKGRIAQYILSAPPLAEVDQLARLVRLERFLRKYLINALRSPQLAFTPDPKLDIQALLTGDMRFAGAHEGVNRVGTFETKLLIRDGYRDMITRAISYDVLVAFGKELRCEEGYVRAGVPLEDVTMAEPAMTRGCHIILGHWADFTGKQDETYEVVAFSSIAGATVDKLTKVNGVSAVTFAYAPGTRVEDRVSREVLAVHFAAAEIFSRIGGAKGGGPEEEEEDEGNGTGDEAVVRLVAFAS